MRKLAAVIILGVMSMTALATDSSGKIKTNFINETGYDFFVNGTMVNISNPRITKEAQRITVFPRSTNALVPTEEGWYYKVGIIKSSTKWIEGHPFDCTNRVAIRNGKPISSFFLTKNSTSSTVFCKDKK